MITKKEKSPLKTSLFPEQQKNFNASFACEWNFKPSWFKKALNNKNALGQACLQNRLKPKWFYKVLNPKRFLTPAVGRQKEL